MPESLNKLIGTRLLFSNVNVAFLNTETNRKLIIYRQVTPAGSIMYRVILRFFKQSQELFTRKKIWSPIVHEGQTLSLVPTPQRRFPVSLADMQAMLLIRHRKNVSHYTQQQFNLEEICSCDRKHLDSSLCVI